MFHCNGWCFPWTLAAAGGIDVCLRKVDAELDLSLIRRTPRHPPVRRADRLQHADRCSRCPRREDRTPSQVGLVAGAAPPVRLSKPENIDIRLTHSTASPKLWARLVCAKQAGLGGVPSKKSAQLNAGRVSVPLAGNPGGHRPETLQPGPADGNTLGEIVFRGNIVMKGYLKNPKRPPSVRGRLVSHGRPRRARTRTAMSSSRIARRTSSSPAARTSPRSRSRMSCTNTPRCCSRPWWRNRIPNGAKCPAPSSTEGQRAAPPKPRSSPSAAATCPASRPRRPWCSARSQT